MLLLLSLLIQALNPAVGFAIPSYAAVSPPSLGFLPCSPESDLTDSLSDDDPGIQFCSKWNPDFMFNGQRCCGKPLPRRKRRIARCAPLRPGEGYCSHVTVEQKNYAEAAASQKVDILELLTQEMGRQGEQSYCTVNNGFLVNGRMLVPTSTNRIQVQSAARCTNFGTDPMIALLEWLGREVSKQYSNEEYSGVQLTVGDVSAPRGGCLIGRSGRRGHVSHTSGQDADVGFLTVKAGQRSPAQFHRQFDAKNNWWLLKQIFKNPYACIKVIFLDKTHIRTLGKYAKSDPDWNAYHRFVRHMPGHRNHMHIRVGNGPGYPGCVPGARPEFEVGEDLDSADADADMMILDELKSRQSSSVQK